MTDIQIRRAEFKDLGLILDLENRIWPPGTRAPKEKFERRLSIFPDGFFLAFRNKELIGASTSQIICYSHENPPKSWEIVTDDGYIEKTHNLKGNALYIVSLGAISRSGAGSALLSKQKGLAQGLGLQYLVLGARIPGYDEYCRNTKEISIELYASIKRSDGLPHDLELRFYIRNGLQIKNIVSNYMEDDAESRNYGAIMVWKNLQYAKLNQKF